MTTTIARPIDSHELLDVAFELAEGARSDTFDTARLRRSVSTSYYALFHELTTAAATLLCGRGSDAEAQRNRVARWVSHTDLLALVRAVRDRSKPAGDVLLEPSAGLTMVAETFVLLQQWRHDADYNHEFGVTQPAAIRLASDASEAVATARELWAAGDESYLRFLRLMVGAVRIAKNR
jgi:uncharacterized protein (UPF0332 family)